MDTETQPASHRSCRERVRGSAPVPAGCAPRPGQVSRAWRLGRPVRGARGRRARRSRRRSCPFPPKRRSLRQTPLSWAARPAPRVPRAAEEQPVPPPPTLETLGARAPSPQRHAALTGTSPRCGSSWSRLPPERRASPAPRSRGGGTEGGILGTWARSCARPRPLPRVPALAPGAEAQRRRPRPGHQVSLPGTGSDPAPPPRPARPPRIPRPQPPGQRSGSPGHGRRPRLRPGLSRPQVKRGASTPLRGSSAASPGTALLPREWLPAD